MLFYLVYGFVYVGFLFHSSQSPVILWYSKPYAVALVVGAVPFLFPTILRRIASRIGIRNLVLAFASFGVVLAGSWFMAHLYYDYTREHPFDPYLQRHAQPLERQYERSRRVGLYRILAIGGSTTANQHLPVEQRYTTQLEKLLAEYYPKREIQVLNAGQNWWTTKHSLINYVTYADSWHPDLVIVMHGMNDLGRSFSHPAFSIGEYNDQYTHYYAQASDAAHHTGFEHYMARWVFTGVSNAWYSRLRFREVTFPPGWYRSREPFRHNLERIVHYVRSDGVEIMLVTQPYLYRHSMTLAEENILFRTSEFIQSRDSFRTDIASIESLAQAMNAFNETTREVAESKGVLLVDAASSIPKDLRYFVDEAHYTPLGARRLAELIADSIVTHGLIDKN